MHPVCFPLSFINPAALPATAVLLCMVGGWVVGSVLVGWVRERWYTRASYVLWSAGAAPYHAGNTLQSFVLARCLLYVRVWMGGWMGGWMG